MANITGKVVKKTKRDKDVLFEIEFFADGVSYLVQKYSAEKLTNDLIKSKILQEQIKLNKKSEDESTITVGEVVDMSPQPLSAKMQYLKDRQNLEKLIKDQELGITRDDMNARIKALRRSLNAVPDADKDAYIGVI